jgi:hypothetical protein
MAKAKPPKPDGATRLPDKFEPDARYRLNLNRVVMNGPNVLRPSHDVIVAGAYAETIREAIDSAEKV